MNWNICTNYSTLELRENLHPTKTRIQIRLVSLFYQQQFRLKAYINF